MTDQADKRGQLIWHLEEALALADDTPTRVPVLRNLTKQWLKLAIELERTQASLNEREPKPKRQYIAGWALSSPVLIPAARFSRTQLWRPRADEPLAATNKCLALSDKTCT